MFLRIAGLTLALILIIGLVASLYMGANIGLVSGLIAGVIFMVYMGAALYEHRRTIKQIDPKAGSSQRRQVIEIARGHRAAFALIKSALHGLERFEITTESLPDGTITAVNDDSRITIHLLDRQEDSTRISIQSEPLSPFVIFDAGKNLRNIKAIITAAQGAQRPTNPEFWQRLDHLIATSTLVIDRPKGSAHPRYPNIIYPLDYGYLEESTAPDGGGVDVWLGSLGRSDPRAQAVVCTVDLEKRDAEYKILIGCTETDVQMILKLHNQHNMRGLLVRR